MGKCSQYIILEKAVSKAVLWQSTSTCQLHWAMSAQTFFKILLWVCCEGFSEWIMHESVDWVQQMALPNMSDPIQYTAGLNRTVGDCLWEEAPARLPELGISLVLLSGYSWNTGSPWVSRRLALRLELYHQLPRISSLVTQISGLPPVCLWEEVSSTFYYSAIWFPPQNVSNLHNHMSQFLGYFLLPLLSVSSGLERERSYWFRFPGEPWLVQYCVL